jgi:hypothetical protein
MSNYSTTSAEPTVTNDDMKEMLAEGATGKQTKAAGKKNKNWGYRIFALILAIAPIVCLCILPLYLVISAESGYALYNDATILKAIIALFKKDGLAEFYAEAGKTITGVTTTGFDTYKFIGLTMLSGVNITGKVASLSIYAIALAMVITLVFAIIALCSGKAAPAMAKLIVFINFWVYTVYAVMVIAIAKYYALDIPVDALILAIAGVSFLFYFIFACLRAGKNVGITLLLFLLSVAFAFLLVYGVCLCGQATLKEVFASTEASFISSVTKGNLYKYTILVAVALAVLGTVISSIRLATKKGYTFDLLRFILHFLIGLFLIVIAFKEASFKNLKLYVAIATAVALVQILIIVAVLSSKKRKKVKVAKTKEEPAATEEQLPTAEPISEEQVEPETGVYAEAVRYEGYKKDANLPEAEALDRPAEPAPEAQPAVYNYTFNVASSNDQPAAATDTNANAAPDYYAARNFDPFIATLNASEREQFMQIFILKYQGETKNLPDYKVGEDNTEFFRKVFIYLGQYRERIPNSLLAKMYQFASKR